MLTVVENILRISRKIWKTKAFSGKCDSSKDLYVHLYLYKKNIHKWKKQEIFLVSKKNKLKSGNFRKLVRK